MRNTPEPSRLLVASNNPHKREELARILTGVALVGPREIGIDFDYEEEADTFHQNALGKALRLHALAEGRSDIRAVIADDSGLCVDALGGRPGVRSNRYGATGERLLSPEGKIDLLLRELGDRADRGASFVCALVCLFEPDRFFLFQEVLRGSIALRPSGHGGFGYDPVFAVSGSGRTVAELDAAEKDAISHRGRAAARLMSVLSGLPAQAAPGSRSL
jgi:XTP/dITP diphosphohydrolase